MGKEKNKFEVLSKIDWFFDTLLVKVEKVQEEKRREADSYGDVAKKHDIALGVLNKAKNNAKYTVEIREMFSKIVTEHEAQEKQVLGELQDFKQFYDKIYKLKKETLDIKVLKILEKLLDLEKIYGVHAINLTDEEYQAWIYEAFNVGFYQKGLAKIEEKTKLFAESLSQHLKAKEQLEKGENKEFYNLILKQFEKNIDKFSTQLEETKEEQKSFIVLGSAVLDLIEAYRLKKEITLEQVVDILIKILVLDYDNYVFKMKEINGEE